MPLPPAPTRPFTLLYEPASVPSLDVASDGLGCGDATPGTVEAALAHIGITRLASGALLQSWVAHPDERVPEAVLRCRVLARALSSDQRVQLFVRAIASADRRAMHWTPLLDAIERAFTDFRLRTTAVRRFTNDLDARLRALGVWIAGSATEQDVTDLLVFRSERIGDVIASFAPRLNFPIAIHLMADCERRELLLNNPSVPRQACEVMLRRIYWQIRLRPRDWRYQMPANIRSLFSLAFDHATYLSMDTLKDVVEWMPTFQSAIDAESNRLLCDVIVATGAHRMLSKPLRLSDLTAFLACNQHEVRLAALGWLAELPFAVSVNS
jgi:hypothetical protein